MMEQDFNGEFCKACQAVLSGNVSQWNKYYAGYEKRQQLHHSSWAELKACGEKDCLLCAFLWHQVDRQHEEEVSRLAGVAPVASRPSSQEPEFHCDAEVAVHQSKIESLSFRLVHGKLYGKGFKVYTRVNFFKLKDDAFSKAGKPVGPSDSTSSQATLQLVTGWLQKCQAEHKSCSNRRNGNWMPTRLVDVGQKGDGVRLNVQPPTNSSYATLSHCWGRRPTAKLLEENLDQFKQGIPSSSLSKTFLHAISVTRSLGLRFIWIDSLCIIQNSTDDWRKESTLMAQIYKNGLFNLAAMESIDGGGGLFRDRDQNLLEPLTIQLVQGGVPIHLTATLYGAYPSSSEVVNGAPLHQRGWVLQERLLSPRTVHFGNQIVFWECRQAIASEQTRQLKESTDRLSFVFGSDKREQTEQAGGVLQRWLSIVEGYSKAGLTFPEKDKLVAVSGIAREVEAQFTANLGDSCTYLAGLWSWNIWFQLLWAVEQSAPRRPSSCGAPSWSWASLDSPIIFLASNASSEHYLITVGNVHVTPDVGGDLLLGVSGGTLSLECYLWPLAVWGSARHPSQDQGNVTLRWDEQDPHKMESLELHLLPVKSYSLFEKMLIGLIVTPTGTQQLRRVGLFEVTGREEDVELDAWHYEIEDTLEEKQWIRDMSCDPSTLQWSDQSRTSLRTWHNVTII